MKVSPSANLRCVITMISLADPRAGSAIITGSLAQRRATLHSQARRSSQLELAIDPLAGTVGKVGGEGGLQRCAGRQLGEVSGGNPVLARRQAPRGSERRRPLPLGVLE